MTDLHDTWEAVKAARALMATRTGHWITPTIDAGMGSVNLRVTCHEPEGAPCRMVVVKESPPWDFLSVPEPPVLEDSGYCQWADWYASVGAEAEFYDGPDNHEVAPGPITIHWEASRGYDDDGAYWWSYIDEETS